ATGDEDGVVRFWATATGAPCGELATRGAAVRALAFAPDGRLAVARADGVEVWPADGKGGVWRVSGTDPGSVAFSARGLLARADGEAVFLHHPAGRPLAILRGHT